MTWMFVTALVSASMLSAAAAAQQEAPTAPRPPAASLTRPTSAAKPVDANGFIQRWLLLEPVKVPGQLTQPAVRAAVEKDFSVAPASLPRDGDKLSLGDTELAWHAVDTL